MTEGDGKDGGDVTLALRVDGVDRRIAFGRDAWRKGRAAWGPLPEQPAAASGGGTEGGTFTAKLCFYETPFIVTVRLTFAADGGEVCCEAESNVGFGPTTGPRWWARPSDAAGVAATPGHASGRAIAGRNNCV